MKRAWWLSITAGAVACAMPRTMERAEPGADSFCPDRGISSLVAPPLDTTRLQWFRAADGRDVELTTRWCETVGGPRVGLAPAVEAPTWEQAGAIDVVTWNMQVGAGDLPTFLDRELGLDCSASPSVLRPGYRPFVLLLQEVWRHSDDLPVVEGGPYVPWTFEHGVDPSTTPDIVEIVERCGLAHLYVPSARNGPDTGSRPREDKGNAILSTLPLSAPLAFDLPHEAGRKVAVAASVVTPQGERVRVVSVHLDVASTLVRTLLSGNQTRVRQTGGLIHAIDRAEREGPVTGVVLVGGDFNTWAANEASLKLMAIEFPDSPSWDGLPTRGAYPADHIYFRRGSYQAVGLSGYERIEERYGSDHHARRATLTRAPAGER